MNFWLVLLISGLVTVAIRYSFIYLLGRAEMPAWARRALRFVPPAVLTAIWVPELLVHDGRLDISLDNARLLAGLLAVLVAWRTRSVIWTIVVGMATLWLLHWLM
jgi:branched-subunit amino acid transport protein